MKHRVVLLSGGLVATLVAVVALTLVAAGTAGTAGSAQSSVVKPPPVPGAAALKAKYGGQSITFVGDNAVGSSQRRR